MDRMGARERKGHHAMPMNTDDDDQLQQPAEDDQQQQQPAEDDDQQPAEDDDQQPAEDDDQQPAEDDDQQTFPLPYVKRLRERSAGYRARAKTAEARVGELERELFTERVRALDLLADPADLPYDSELLDDPDALAEAVQQLVRDRPHYRRRGTIDAAGTGSRDQAGAADGVSLTGIMRGSA